MSLNVVSSALKKALTEIENEKKELEVEYKKNCVRLDFRIKLSIVLCQDVPNSAITYNGTSTNGSFRYSAKVENLVFKNTWCDCYGVYLESVDSFNTNLPCASIDSLASLGYWLDRLSGATK